MSGMLLLATLTYGIGQSTNFLFQLHLLHLLGSSAYGDAGLAHLLLITLIFLADLGYSSIFLRQAPDHPGWPHDWACALSHRLGVTLLLLSLCSFAVSALAADSAAFDYWLGAAPAALLALFNFSSPLIARGQRLRALLSGQIAWPVALLLSLTLPTCLPFSTATSAGIAVSLGFAVQALVHLLLSRKLRLWLPRLGSGQFNAALHLSTLSICSTLHDRLTPFLLAPLTPSFLPWYLLISHALNGLSGIQAQLSRLLLPGAARDHGREKVLQAGSWALQGTAALLISVLLLQAATPDPEQRYWLALAGVLLLAWGISVSGGFLGLPLIDANREHAMAQLFVITMAISAPLQVLAAWAQAPDLLLWTRTLCLASIMLGVIRLQHLRLSGWGWLAMGGALLAGIAGFNAAAPWFGVLLALPLVVAVAGRTPCYRPASALQTST
ncbi:hypothetical protein A9179_07580 [Pseudomonas alcaligenes]|uniref:Polysaccharide biosynthesis protein n=1 Tax=Aquipseudomonas alcaligenes TaxID=43263 RepID=A0ABR7RXS0_AQUAC|nr:hypothetical protein [Pseudomonas alcaligenes]MBC9250131.1 hypothetical protein [Pseudomonas alcaligenes]